MKRHTRSLLEELTSVKNSHDRKHVIERTGETIIQSAIQLFEGFQVEYDSETALELERRLINSIRARDTSRFTRGISKAVKK